MRELKEAEFWLDSAKRLLNSEPHDSEKYTVVIAQSIHSIIRANVGQREFERIIIQLLLMVFN